MDNLIRSFVHIAEHLPAIDGFSVSARPMSHDDISQNRLDAREVGEVDAIISVEREIENPGRELEEYRFRCDRSRRRIVRDHVMDVTSRIDEVLRDVTTLDGIGHWRGADRWVELHDLFSELDRLVGNMVPGHARWSDLRRHLHFAEPNDLSDIATIDWPSVRAEVEGNLYDDLEPIPVTVDDLGSLARTRPSGPVSTRLSWAKLTPDDFERLVFELIRQTKGYENVNWLMKPNAADRGRDIAADRVIHDDLIGVRRERVIVQCKHWQNRSVGRAELIECAESVKLWEPPSVDALIIATTGRFSQDAVSIAEKRNHERQVPRIDLWPESHLEALLSRRPALSANFGLR